MFYMGPGNRGMTRSQAVADLNETVLGCGVFQFGPVPRITEPPHTFDPPNDKATKQTATGIKFPAAPIVIMNEEQLANLLFRTDDIIREITSRADDGNWGDLEREEPYPVGRAEILRPTSHRPDGRRAT